MLLSEVNFLRESTPCSISERGLLELVSEAREEEDNEVGGAIILVGVAVGVGTLVGKYPNLAVGRARGMILGSDTGVAFVCLYFVKITFGIGKSFKNK